ncbi:hypothetical protein NDU88_007880 [Pleurodeles waltl]|uniref:Uncharacterized protein n=1 Tax=Pleurodeles waltl TaxID=8319 RepID=A0AAV7VVN2_PLEWA|nr:hypothetical protein NDU88_007880 [Pleurodeles waltl]
MNEGVAAVQAPLARQAYHRRTQPYSGLPKLPVICALQALPPDHARLRLLIRSKADRPTFPLRSLLAEPSASHGNPRGPRHRRPSASLQYAMWGTSAHTQCRRPRPEARRSTEHVP